MTSIADKDRRLNILQVLEPSGGGSGRHFIDLCGSLAARGHNVTAVYSPVRAEERFVAELKALPLKAVHDVTMKRAPGPSDIAAWRALNRIIKTGGPFDIIHGQSSKAGALTRLRLPGRHVARVYTPHAFRTMDPTLGTKGRLLFGLIESLFGRFLTDGLICVSDDEKRHAEQDLKIPARLLHTVVNGVVQPPSGQRDQIRAGWNIAPDSFVFGFVGRLSAQKAPERLIEAFRRIAPALPQAKLVMIGFGELQQAVEAQIRETGLDGRIVLTSEISGSRAMQAFDALVMPSRYEAMSYVMLEAAAAGLPMVLSDVGGASTVLKDGENGLVVGNEDDPAALAAAMQALAAPERYRAIKAAAEARSQNYSLEAMVAATEAVYRRLV